MFLFLSFFESINIIQHLIINLRSCCKLLNFCFKYNFRLGTMGKDKKIEGATKLNGFG